MTWTEENINMWVVMQRDKTYIFCLKPYDFRYSKFTNRLVFSYH